MTPSLLRQSLLPLTWRSPFVQWHDERGCVRAEVWIGDYWLILRTFVLHRVTVTRCAESGCNAESRVGCDGCTNRMCFDHSAINGDLLLCFDCDCTDWDFEEDEL